MCEFGVLDVFGYTPTEPHGLTSLLYRRQPPLGSLRSARYASPLSVTPEGLLQGRRALPIYRNIFTLPGFVFDSTNSTFIHAPNATYGTSILAVQGNYLMGSYTDSSVQTQGFIYDGTNFTTLEVPGNSYNGGNTYSQVTGMQGTNFIGNYTEDYHGTEEGFVYDGSMFTTISDPDALYDTYLTGSQGTNLIGYYNSTDGGTHGFIYNGSSFTTFDDPIALTSTNRHSYSIISGSVGNYLFGSYSYNGVENGWVYDGTNFTTLDDPSGVEGTYITGSMDGTNLVGYYTDGSGLNHGFIAYGAVPEPSCLALFGLGALALLFGWNRRRAC